MRRVPVIGPDPEQRLGPNQDTSGSYKLFAIRPGVTVTVFDVVVGARFGSSRIATEPCVAIDVLFEASGEGRLLPPDGSDGISVPYRPGLLYLFYAGAGVEGKYDIPVGSRFRGVDIRVDLDFLQKLGAQPLFAQLGADHPLYAASCTDCWIGTARLSAQLAPLAQSLFDLGASDGDDLSMEARCLDMITAALGLLRDTTPPAHPSQRDRRKCEVARDALLSDLARPWTVTELARHAGLNEKRLKAGFREFFGSAVYRFLQKARLDEAKRLLGTPDANVTIVAQSVGYNSPSHFAKLFAREFGFPPSAYHEHP